MTLLRREIITKERYSVRVKKKLSFENVIELREYVLCMCVCVCVCVCQGRFDAQKKKRILILCFRASQYKTNETPT